MRVLIHSNAPFVPSGFGKQSRLAGQILRDLGHEVAFSCFSGLGGQPIKWDNFTLFPSGQLDFGVDTLPRHAATWQPDLIIPIMDLWKLAPCADTLSALSCIVAPLVITDCTAENGGPGMPDQEVLARLSGTPAAVSSFARERLAAIGYDAPLLPHCYDGTVYIPPGDRQALREELGTPGDFVIGICAANSDGLRKAWPEQFAAFARFSRRHKDARLAVFSVWNHGRGLNLPQIASDMGIAERVVWMPVYEQVAGMLGEEFMAQWYGSLDILSLCSYGEGFGVPLIEAQACGTPVVATDGSAMIELARPAGWLVKGTPFWNPTHRAWWTRPDTDAIVKAWEKAYAEGPSAERRDRARNFAAGYDREFIRDTCWAPFMKQIEDAL